MLVQSTATTSVRTRDENGDRRLLPALGTEFLEFGEPEQQSRRNVFRRSGEWNDRREGEKKSIESIGNEMHTWKTGERVNVLSASPRQLLGLAHIDACLPSSLGVFGADQTTQAFWVGLDHRFQGIATTVGRVPGAIEVVQARCELVKARRVLRRSRRHQSGQDCDSNPTPNPDLRLHLSF